MKKLLFSIVSALLFFTLSAQVSENFSDYTVGGKLAQQAQEMGRDYWDTWSNAPGGSEDGVIADLDGNNVLFLNYGNDQLLHLGKKNSGLWELTFKILIPSGKNGYFNVQANFTGTQAGNWMAEIYFATKNGGSLPQGSGTINAGGTDAASFNFTHGEWINVKLTMDLDNDDATLFLNNNLIYNWEYSAGANGGGGCPRVIDAFNMFPPTNAATSSFYIADIVFAPVMNVIYETNFDDFTAGSYVALSDPDWWTTWENKPGTSEDALISTEQAQSAPNSAKCSYNTDLVFKAGDQTSGEFTIDFDMYIPENGTGYFNLIQLLNGDGSIWALDVFFNLKTNPFGLPQGTFVGWNDEETFFNMPNFDEWFHVSVTVDLDQDLGWLSVAGEQVFEWIYSIDVQGDEGIRQLAAVDFWPPTSGSLFYIDNFKFSGGGGDNFPIMDVTPTSITEIIVPGEIVNVPITVENSGTSMGDYTSWVEFVFEPLPGTNNYTLMHGSGIPSSSGGLGYPSGSFLLELGAKFSGSQLCDKVGAYINKLSYFLPDNNGGVSELTFRIYGPERSNAPGEVLVEVVKTSVIENNWNEVTLPTPFLIDKNELWITVELMHNEGAYPIGVDSGPLELGSNFTRRDNGSWQVFSQTEFGNFLIKTEAQGDVVPACWLSLDGEIYGSVPMSSSKTFDVVFDATGIDEGTYTANIIVATSDEDNPLFTIPCTIIVGSSSSMSVNPLSIDELITDLDEIITIEMTVKNSGNIAGDYTVEPVTEDWLTLSGNITGTIEPGENDTFQVELSIDSTFANGTYSSEIKITTTDILNNVITVPCKLIVNLKGVGEYSIKTLVFPNPTNDRVTILSNQIINNIQLYNHLGQIVYSSIVNGERTTINTSNFSAGIYFIKVNTDLSSQSMKLIIK
ncbi:MAG: T9SS type A sorting domain-containing protein [Bacteroidales bacterium]|jgi:hypothetical protein|nr:T9SS type A sorting domain-containing protein [Bacteroidales bacterium]